MVSGARALARAISPNGRRSLHSAACAAGCESLQKAFGGAVRRGRPYKIQEVF